MPIYNPISLPSASAAALSRLVIDRFLGADLTNAPANVDLSRSPDCENMIRDVPGKVRKRMGWRTVLTLPGRINGCWTWRDGSVLLHAGDALYRLTRQTAGTGAEPADPDGDGKETQTPAAPSPAEKTAEAGQSENPAGGEASGQTGAAGTETAAGQSENNAGETAGAAAGGQGGEETAGNAEEFIAEQIAFGLADRRSAGWLLGEKLLLADGSALWVFDGKTLSPAAEGAYLPTVTIGRAPEGGGTAYEGLNLLNPSFTEQFLGTADAKRYQLSFAPLDAAAVTAELLQSDGSWKALAEGKDFSVDRTAGALTFVTPPGESPLDGQDNLKITAARTVEGYADRVGRCRVGILYGVGGASDRLFLSGNPDYPNRDWYSGYNDPTYWEDSAYSVLGRGDSAIMGYSILAGRLATHKDGREPERAVILREGTLTDGRPAFTVTGSLQGAGAVSRWAFGYLAGEPLFLSKLGVFAVTSQDITGEKISNLRSFYLNGQLLEESGLADAFAFVHRDLYLLCVGGRAYILDGLQPTATDKSAPYSTRQYAGFLCTHIPARVLWEADGALWFGTEEGKVCRFAQDPGMLTSYADDGAPVYACWRTPDFSGEQFYHSKSFCRFAVMLSSAAATGFVARVRVRGIWRELARNAATARYFSYANLCYSKFTYSNDDSPRTIGGKIRIKKVDKAGFLLENGELNEPFSPDALALEFIESGYYKGG